MTGLVVVSHSRALAEAAVALAGEMVHGDDVRIEVAAGLDETTFGTDATAIVAAVESADDGEGVVVLMDLGSAVLSAETALEILDPDLRDRVLLSPAPLVEGLVLAAVAAAGGADRGQVASEAAGGLAAKEQHLGTPSTQGDAVGASASAGLSATFVLDTAHGLHARPASRFVAAAQEALAAGGLEAITARNATTGAGPVEADSMLGVLTLGAEHGHEVEVTATGVRAQEALDALLALAADRFGESE